MFGENANNDEEVKEGGSSDHFSDQSDDQSLEDIPESKRQQNWVYSQNFMDQFDMML